MTRIRVGVPGRAYGILVGGGLLARAGRLIRAELGNREICVISAAPVIRLHGRRLAASLRRAGLKARWLRVPDGEKAKSWSRAGVLLRSLARAGTGRDGVIAAFGGGAVGDLAGFVAATYARGIALVHLPTTLIAQMDSAIGGKTGVDLPEGKNLAGAFYQPRLVIADTDVLRTLPRRQLRAGLAEAVKHGIIRSAGLFRWIEANARRLLARDRAALEKLVCASARIKAKVVSRDEREAGERIILNFGHTAGHAAEAAAGFSGLLHGEAVAIGMACAARLSARLGLCGESVPARIERLLAGLGLPVKAPALSRKKLLSALAVDKKNVRRKLRIVLTRRIGSVTVKPGIGPRVVLDELRRQ